jgi:hypothetical protein
MNWTAAFDPFVELRIFRISSVLSSARYRERRVVQVGQIRRICCTVIVPRSHAQRGESTVGTRRSYREALNLFDIYNMNETALYYKSSSDNSLASEQLVDEAINKSRIITNFCCNANSSYKLDIFFIAKTLRPHAFKDIIYIKSLSCQWKKIDKSWINKTVFIKFLN